MKFSGFWGAALGAILPLLFTASSHAITIVHSNDVLGEIEPCGCRTNPLGGYARKANLLKGLKDRELLQLDAGDLLFASENIPEVLKSQSFLQAQWILKILGQLHQDAVTPGEKDFSLGLTSFKKLIRGSSIRFLAANLQDGSGKNFLPASAIFTRTRANGKKMKIAVLGLVGADLPWPDGLRATDPIASAKKLVPGLRKKADFVIALTHEGLPADQNLAKHVPGIDIIIGGHTQSFLQNPLKIGSTIIYQSSFRNQYVGLIDLKTFPSEDSYQLVGLDSNYDSPAGFPRLVDEDVKNFKAAIAKLNSDELPVQLPPGEHPRFQTFPRCAECHLKQFDFWRKTPHAMALAALVKSSQDKNKECLQCHTVGLGDPKGYHHVNRLVELNPSPDSPSPKPSFVPNSRFVDYLASIHEGKSLNDPARGISSDDKPLTIDQSLGHIKQAWVPVQCENCHGPGEDHPMSGHYSKQVALQVCMSCHTPTRAPEWYLSNGKPNWEKIKAKHAMMSCPSGDLSTGE